MCNFTERQNLHNLKWLLCNVKLNYSWPLHILASDAWKLLRRAAVVEPDEYVFEAYCTELAIVANVHHSEARFPPCIVCPCCTTKWFCWRYVTNIIFLGAHLYVIPKFRHPSVQLCRRYYGTWSGSCFQNCTNWNAQHAETPKAKPYESARGFMEAQWRG